MVMTRLVAKYVCGGENKALILFISINISHKSLQWLNLRCKCLLFNTRVPVFVRISARTHIVNLLRSYFFIFTHDVWAAANMHCIFPTYNSQGSLFLPFSYHPLSSRQHQPHSCTDLPFNRPKDSYFLPSPIICNWPNKPFNALLGDMVKLVPWS